MQKQTFRCALKSGTSRLKDKQNNSLKYSEMFIRPEITIMLFLCVKSIMKKWQEFLVQECQEVLGNRRDKVLCLERCASKTTRNARGASVGMF